jgi:glycosyltransferase involved in cell wall biosynthesis
LSDFGFSLSMPFSSTHLVLIPSYNTGPRLRDVVLEALGKWQPIIVVIDGSTDGSEQAVLDLARREAGLSVIVLPQNQGKGAAFLAGARAAVARGYTHALAMDADGQHPAAKIAEFMDASQRQPDTLVLGRPIFPSNIPRERLYGRKISVALVRWAILGGGIDDPLYGFRIYPLRPLLEVLGSRRTGRRYDFDAEAAVRLCWSGIRPINIPAPVRYLSREEGGVSHFHYVRDNITLGRMHTRLVVELMARVLEVLRHRRRWRAEAAPAVVETSAELLANVSR